jgi:hypothetical protein
MSRTVANDPVCFSEGDLLAELASVIANSPIHLPVSKAPARASADRLPAGYDAWDAAVLNWIAAEAKLFAPRILFI